MKRVVYRILLLLLACSVTACALLKKPDKYIGERGSVIARAEWPDELPSDLVTVRMTVSASDMKTVSQDFKFSDTRGQIHGIHGVPAGDNRTVIVEGLDSDYKKLFEGSVSNTAVLSGQIADCGLILMNRVRDIPLSQTVIRAEAGHQKVTIRWDSVSGADNYSIYMNRSPGASKKNFDARKITTSTSYQWTGLSNGTTYYFVVTAEGGYGESSESNEVASTPDIAPVVTTAPPVPTNVAAEAGNGKVTIRWDTVSGAVNYSIYMNRSQGASKKNFDARKATSSSSYVWEGLSKGTTYYFILTAENSYGESIKSNEVNSTPGATAVAPGAPVPPPVPVPFPEPPEAPAAAPKAPILAPSEVLKKADQIRAPGKSFVQEVTITFNKGQKETVSKMSIRVRDYAKSLVIYRYPASEKGRVILMVENNMWIYFPGTRKAIRISPAQQLLGQVSNADVARVVFSLDYNAESVEDDNTGNEELLKIFLKAKTKGAAYGSIKLWMKKDSFKLVKAEFFTLSGRLLKTIYYKGYKHMLGKERPTIYEIHDAIRKSEITIMEYSKMKLEDTPDNYFQKTFMHRVPGLSLSR